MEFKRLNFRTTEEAVRYTEEALIAGTHYQCADLYEWRENHDVEPCWTAYQTEDYQLVDAEDHDIVLDPTRALVIAEEVK